MKERELVIDQLNAMETFDLPTWEIENIEESANSGKEPRKICLSGESKPTDGSSYQWYAGD